MNNLAQKLSKNTSLKRVCRWAGRAKRRSIQFVEHLTGDGPTVFRHVCNMGLECILSKRADAPYHSGPFSVVPVARLDPNQAVGMDHRSSLDREKASMSTPGNYSASERLRDGRTIEIRALRPDDKDDMLAAVGRTGTQSLQRRFFAVKRGFSDMEIAFFMNIDFTSHVALVALADEDGRKVIIGGGRYIVTEPGKAEIAFVVIDDYQGQGVGTLLMRHLAVIARAARLKELIAEVLPENAAMRKVFSKFGFQHRRGPDPRVVHLMLTL